MKINKGKLQGFNTDVIGFEKSLLPLLHNKPNIRALILGNGGAAKAVQYVLGKNHIAFTTVTRLPVAGMLTYKQIDKEIIGNHQLIVNTTPLGMYPKIDECPALPYEAIGTNHLLYDLVYNPEQTLFLKKGREQGAIIQNGLPMLHLQAAAAWDIWNS